VATQIKERLIVLEVAIKSHITSIVFIIGLKMHFCLDYPIARLSTKSTHLKGVNRPSLGRACPRNNVRGDRGKGKECRNE
jgi:hypothetical protein